MARSIRRTVRARRPIFILRRGGGGGPDNGNFVGYVASAFGGKADCRVAVVNGVVQTAVPKGNRDWDFFDYALGTFTTANGGFGWNGASGWSPVFKAVVGLEWFASYAVGPVPEMTGGSGWIESGVWGVPYTIRVGEEQFETYQTGVVSGADLSGGTGWAGAPLVVTP